MFSTSLTMVSAPMMMTMLPSRPFSRTLEEFFQGPRRRSSDVFGRYLPALGLSLEVSPAPDNTSFCAACGSRTLTPTRWMARTSMQAFDHAESE
jgi:hypothetical protein